MNFFDRFNDLCREHTPSIDPAGRQIAQILGIDRSNVTKWKQNGTTPKGDTVKIIADFFNVSADYLLGRTPDRTDYSHYSDALSEKESRFLQLFRRLDGAGIDDCLKYLEFSISKQEDDKKKASSSINAKEVG